MLATARLLHASLSVADLEASVAFYGAAFGYTLALPPTDLGTAFAQMTGVPGARARLAQLQASGGGPALELIASPQVPAPAAVPPAHVAFAVADLDAALAAACAAGAEMLGEVVRFAEGRSAYCREPGGSVFELEELFE